VSAITLAELSVGPLVATTDVERSARQSVLQQVVPRVAALPVDVGGERVDGDAAEWADVDGFDLAVGSSS
jgi:tRNA(fMet)-specific endonuclease VapC